ncbi:MAG TPA: helix-turn-helix transcriptional regulator, partial [Chloroflexia bacterium]|nr:helix-turn-helix transcriptional regulator [Chloroflexia bacterium]
PVHLARAFRLHFGETPGQYVRRLRLDWSATQLATTDLSITELASMAGFADQSHFTRVFKSHTGFTPAQYRQCSSKSGRRGGRLR